MESVRLDKWLWAVRLYKTRSLATEACRKGRIIVNGLESKPSREVRTNDTVIVRKLPVIYTYRIKSLIDNRQPAKAVKDYVDDLTSVEELDKLKIKDTFFIRRDKGSGRPTKKERRDIDDLIENIL